LCSSSGCSSSASAGWSRGRRRARARMQPAQTTHPPPRPVPTRRLGPPEAQQRQERHQQHEAEQCPGKPRGRAGQARSYSGVGWDGAWHGHRGASRAREVDRPEVTQ
jgi:hypothetical protein